MYWRLTYGTEFIVFNSLLAKFSIQSVRAVRQADGANKYEGNVRIY